MILALSCVMCTDEEADAVAEDTQTTAESAVRVLSILHAKIECNYSYFSKKVNKK